MAIINCPECGKEISDKALSCPYCGNPFSVNSTPLPTPVKKNKLKNLKLTNILSIIGIIFAISIVLSPLGVLLSIIALLICLKSKAKEKTRFVFPLISLILSALVLAISVLAYVGVIPIPSNIRTFCYGIVVNTETIEEQIDLTKENFEYYFNINSYCTDYSESKTHISLYGYDLGTDYDCSCNFHVEISPKNEVEIYNAKVTFNVFTTWNISGIVGQSFTIELPSNGTANKIYSCSEKTYWSKAGDTITPHLSSASGTMKTYVTKETTLGDIIFSYQNTH